MAHFDNVIDIRRPVEFTIDGRAYQTRNRRQRAADLLVLAGLDPDRDELCQLSPPRRHGERLRPPRYAGTDIVEIRRGTRLLSIRDRAGAV